MLSLVLLVAFAPIQSFASQPDYDYLRLQEARATANPSVYGENHADNVEKNDLSSQTDQLLVKLTSKAKKSALNSLNKKIGAIIIDENKNDKLYIIKIPDAYSLEEAIEHYNSSSSVQYVEPNYSIERMVIPDDAKFSQLWNLHNTGQLGGKTDADIDAPEAWDTITDCSDIVVAVMDDGIEFSHPDLASNMWINEEEIPDDGLDNDGNGYVDDVYGYDFADDDPDISPDVATDDSAGHGTHVAGIIGASGNNGIGITGICWDVKLMSLKIFDRFGSSFKSDLIEAAQYAIMMKNNGVNIKVVNMSFGSSGTSTTEFDAIKQMRDAGILITAAAGNSGYNSNLKPVYPASYGIDNIIAVASTGNTDKRSSFSNYGADLVDVAAPGEGIVSSYVDGTYDSLSGTSMAAPHVAGIAALVAADDSTLGFAEIRAKILNGATVLSSLKSSTATSARVNANDALSASPGLPDIKITNVKTSYKDGDDEASASLTLKNTGLSTSDSTFIDVFAATDPEFQNIFDSETISISSLRPGISSSATVSVDVSSLGDDLPTFVYLLAVSDFDDFLSESDEENNTYESSILLSNKDLSASSLSIETSSIKLAANKDIKASVTIKNIGKVKITEDVAVKLYLSSNTKLDDSDTPLAEGTLTKDISPKKSQKLGIKFQVPSEIPVGKYYVIAEINGDDAIAEKSKENNVTIKSIKVK